MCDGEGEEVCGRRLTRCNAGSTCVKGGSRGLRGGRGDSDPSESGSSQQSRDPDHLDPV